MQELEKVIYYEFKNKNILKRALTHPSFISNQSVKLDYEIYEFLGDSVLNLVITEYLIQNYPLEKEGDLAKRRASLVCGDVITKIALEINLGKHIIMATSEDLMGGRKNPHNLENALEALIGALYLDGGIEETKNFIIKFWHPIAKVMESVPSNPKTALQEWSQGHHKGVPKYQVISSVGKPHAPLFEVKVQIDNHLFGIGYGSSKKIAESNAAKMLLKSINSNE